MRIRNEFLVTVLFVWGMCFLNLEMLHAAPVKKSVFTLQNPDYATSPLTGMTRKHWKDAATYMLDGAFSYINSYDDAMKFPKQHEISYPRNPGQVPTEKLEGLSRTLFVAAPLLKENPNLVLNNIKVADYYRHQICNLFRPESESYIKHRARNGGPSQNLVEFGALAISLSAAPDVLWEPLSKSQKDSLAALMISYGDGPTVNSNWKFFNIFVLSFFKKQGYEVNDKLLLEYLDKSLTHYRGYGWYDDSPAYDYYSMWAFQMYGILWAEYYGDFFPTQAGKFREYFADLEDNYSYLFARDGKMNMWGRSIAYRYAAATVFPLMAFEKDQNTNWGWMRRIASSTILQFFTHPDFMQDGVPTLGFYGPFEPATQMYSCRGSVYWGGKIFLGLLVPESHPFWNEKENEGAWQKELQKGKVYNKFQPGSDLLITNYPNIGASEVRSWCHETVAGDWQKFRSTENYNRLAYNTAFPWQADGKLGEVAMNYVVKNKKGEWEALRLYTFKRFENGVYYRDAELETDRNLKFKLADITLPDGILRVDKIYYDNADSSGKQFEVRLGHYALPQFTKPMRDRTWNHGSHRVKTIDNGQYQLAMIPWKRWGDMQFVHATGLHPESNASAVINAFDTFDTSEKNWKVYITLQLWKKSGENWKKNALVPVKKVKISDDGNSVVITFRDKTSKTVML